MRIYDIINKKKYGETLTKEELEYVVNGFTNGDIPDYQMSALLMAIYFNGMAREEITNLTIAMAHSGDVLDLSAIRGKKVDKHSTGGVGDKTSLVIGPILASLGVPVAKMSGRGLGHTGGTIDKLESIAGFQTTLSDEQFIQNVNDIGIALVGQTANLAPADKKIYALRDVTATVDSEGLIASSIMSKKLAAGADAIVLDVKVGSGAFMKTKEEAVSLAGTMVDIGKLAGRDMYALITDMNEPLGSFVGNALEVQEAIEVLKGNGERRLKEVCLNLAGCMLLAAGKTDSIEAGIKLAEQTIADRTALEKMKAFIEAQGGNARVCDDYSLFPQAAEKIPVIMEKSGYLAACNTEEVGMVSLMLGGGREKKTDEIDMAVGIELHKHLGDYIEAGEPLGWLYANKTDRIDEIKDRLLRAYTLSGTEPEKKVCIYETIL